MQDRYAGDVGDFGKFSLLKELSRRGLSIGINWYKTKTLDSEKNQMAGLSRTMEDIRRYPRF